MSEEKLVQKERKGFPFVIVAISVIVLVIVIVLTSMYIKSSNNERRLQEQLDFGDKYLTELDYVQAIVAYETAIEIDPMCVDAYLGLASVYEVQGDYDKALEVLEAGYLQTNSEILFNKIETIKNLIIDGENNIDNDLLEENVMNEYENGVPDRVVDGVYHNAYSVYDLSADDEEYLLAILELLESEKYVEVSEYIQIDRLASIVNTCSNGGESINILINKRKVYIDIGVHDDAIWFYRIVDLPINDGQGYAFEKDFYEGYEDSLIYTKGECLEGVFWGEFTTIQLLKGGDGTSVQLFYEMQAIGSAVNGLIDGEYKVVSHSYQNTDIIRTEIFTYNMGLVNYWNLKSDNGGVSYCISVDENGQENIIVDMGQTLEECNEYFNTYRHVPNLWNSVLYPYEEINGGYRYYPW